MDDLLKWPIRSAVLFICAALLLWAVYPPAKPITAGLILGILASLLNAALLRRRVELAAQIAAGLVGQDKPARRPGLGFISRTATVLLAAMIAYRYPQHFSIITAIAGSFYIPIATLVFGFTRNRSHFHGKG